MPHPAFRISCVLALLAAAPAVRAQETPTERDAARDVIQKMAALEQSLDVNGWVKKLAGTPNPARDQVVARAKELMDKELLAMADDIATHPEIGFEETRSVQKLADYLKQHDFDVEMGVAGLKTAFVAKYRKNNGAPTLGVILEYDALRGTKGPFHGDQHSAQGPVGIAAAVAMAEYLTRTHSPGSVVVYGTPGEEMMPPNAKTVMHEGHVFDGADIIVRSHAVGQTTRPAPGFGTCCLNIVGAKYTFIGAPAHQMTAWAGRNALEAVIHLFENIDSVRSNIRPEARIQGVITEGGTAPNVVPDRAVADFYIRYPDEVYLQQVVEFVDNAAKAAALSTGTKVKIDHYGKDLDGIGVATLGEVAFAYMKQYGATNLEMQAGKPQGYEETGSVSRDIPGIGLSAQSSTFANHTYGMDEDNLREIGHKGFTIDAEAMAAVLFDFATHEDYRAAVKKEFAGIKALFGEYQTALKKVYTVPVVPEPK
ncbi:MAG TPA: peptidase dimerization domain-containing protein [Vicinamibacterales bacterium]|jgi:amidohydrolase|nr:peptidase dimerization domain-containing protein [Vicinamibacterales bacterium]